MNRHLQKCVDALHRGKRFVAHDVWRIGRPGDEIPHGFIIKQVRVAILLVQGLVKDDLLLRASSLTFATILSIVPFLAIMFFIIQTFGLREAEALGDFLSPTPAPAAAAADPQAELTEAQRQRAFWNDFLALMFRGFEKNSEAHESGSYANPVQWMIDSAQRSSNPRTLTLAGVLFVITTVFGLMMNIESSFNRIWGVRRNRSWYRMFSDYVIILLLLPFLAAGVLSVTAVLESAAFSQRLGPAAAGIRGVQYALSWFVFTALYFVVPNTRVRLRYALGAGIIAGTAWCLLSLGYVKFQFGLPRYNLLYTTLAQVPVLLMWVYCSWLVLLVGAEIAFAYQNEKTFAMERLAEGASFAYKEAVGLWAMVEMSRRFDAGLPGMSADVAAEHWNVPTRLLNETLSQLEEARLVVRSASKPPIYQPARSVDKITVADVMGCLRRAGQEPSALRLDPTFRLMFDRIRDWPGGPTACTLANLVHATGTTNGRSA